MTTDTEFEAWAEAFELTYIGKQVLLSQFNAARAPLLERIKELESQLSELEKQELVAHMFPFDLQKFEESEIFAQAFSLPVGNPDERSVPLYSLAAPAILDGMALDAKRYRWLMANCGFGIRKNQVTELSIMLYSLPNHIGELDAAIDAAMLASAQGETK